MTSKIKFSLIITLLVIISSAIIHYISQVFDSNSLNNQLKQNNIENIILEMEKGNNKILLFSTQEDDIGIISLYKNGDGTWVVVQKPIIPNNQDILFAQYLTLVNGHVNYNFTIGGRINNDVSLLLDNGQILSEFEKSIEINNQIYFLHDIINKRDYKLVHK